MWIDFLKISIEKQNYRLPSFTKLKTIEDATGGKKGVF